MSSVERSGHSIIPFDPSALRQAQGRQAQGTALLIIQNSTHHSPLTTHHSPLTTHHSPLTTHYSPLTTHHSPLTTHHSPLTTHYSLLTFIPFGNLKFEIWNLEFGILIFGISFFPEFGILNHLLCPVEKNGMKQWILAFTTCMLTLPAFAQTDSTKQVFEPKDSSGVVISAFGQYRSERQVQPAIHLLQGASLDRYNKTNFVQSLNTLPGVRMEERSPGSYRLNMRGSSLRSPFGIRNVKVYYNGLPLTDAGGNTYFNQLAFHNIASMEIAKGPAGSMYGAGTGGLVMLHSLHPKQKGMEAEIMAGSFGLMQAMGSARWELKGKLQAAGISYTEQNGYRDHTNMRRMNASYSGEWVKKEHFNLQGHLLASNLQYQTPGGLTLAEYHANPKQARPKVGTQPSAQDAKAAIYQDNFLAGLTAQWKLDAAWSNETGIYGTWAGVRNPAIRNYEERREPGWGARTSFVYSRKQPTHTDRWITGAETQWGDFNTQVFTNKQGEKGIPLTHDDLNFFTWNAFTQWQRQYDEKWDLTAGISYFQNKVAIQRLFPAGNDKLKKDYTNDWAPRVSVIFRPVGQWQISGLVSRGFSPPTVSELLPSTGIISTGLQPEYGWNYEAGVKWQSTDATWNTGINFFRFDLHKALVQRRDSTGADFYTNAGGTRQQGIEWTGNYLLTRSAGNALQVFSLKSAYTYSYFQYTDYKQLTNDFSGNTLPSVPAHTFSFLCDLQWRSSFFVQSTFYAASSIWLNDANTAKADAYELVGLKTGFGKRVQVYAGIDNLLDETYSLGNDINAFGGRFFNVAAGRNLYGGVKLKF
jgi:iron complex outermembrane receptor protein